MVFSFSFICCSISKRSCLNIDHWKAFDVLNKMRYTAISRKVVGKNVHATIPKGNMGYDQYAVANKVAVESPIVA